MKLDLIIKSIDRETNIDKMYDIKSEMSLKVEIEPLRKN